MAVIGLNTKLSSPFSRISTLSVGAAATSENSTIGLQHLVQPQAWLSAMFLLRSVAPEPFTSMSRAIRQQRPEGEQGRFVGAHGVPDTRWIVKRASDPG